MNTIALPVNKQVPGTYYVPGAGDTPRATEHSSKPKTPQVTVAVREYKRWDEGVPVRIQRGERTWRSRSCWAQDALSGQLRLTRNGEAGKALSSGILEAMLGAWMGHNLSEF